MPGFPQDSHESRFLERQERLLLWDRYICDGFGLERASLTADQTSHE